MNVYYGTLIKADGKGNPAKLPYYEGFGRTAHEWPVIPEALYWGPRFLFERYKKPILITENGMSNLDWISLDGKVHDPRRIDFTARYLKELKRAGEDGVELMGNFHWCVMDNFEWIKGYQQRFGLIYIDYPTQRRVLKDSAHWYREVIATNGGKL